MEQQLGNTTPRVIALVTSSGRLFLLRHDGAGERSFFSLLPVPARPPKLVRFLRAQLSAEIGNPRQIAVVGGDDRLEAWTARLVGRASGRWSWLIASYDATRGEVVEREVGEDDLAARDLRPEVVKHLLTKLAQSKLRWGPILPLSIRPHDRLTRAARCSGLRPGVCR